MPNALVQPRLAHSRVGSDRYIADAKATFAGLDQCFKGVGIRVVHLQLQRGETRKGPKTTGSIWHLGKADAPDEGTPQLFQQALHRRKVLILL